VFRGAFPARSPLAPVAEFRFRGTERIHVAWPIAAPARDPAARLLDRRGQPLDVPLALAGPAVTAGAGEEIVVDLRLNTLSSGDYVIEVSTGAGADRQLLAFRLER
jgi:hypothetical protein